MHEPPVGSFAKRSPQGAKEGPRPYGQTTRDAVPDFFQTGGNQAFLSLLGRAAVQPKSRAGSPVDRFEQQADAAAEAVMSGSRVDGGGDALSQLTGGETVQRKCASCGGKSTHEKCEACAREEEKSRLSAKRIGERSRESADESPVSEAVSESAPTQESQETGEPATQSEMVEAVAPTGSGSERGTEAETGPTEAAASGLLLDDSAEEVGPEQMKKSDFLDTLRSAVCETVDQALAGTGRDSEGCPHVEYWFGFLAGKDASYIERGIQRFAPEAAGVTSAAAYIPAVVSRVRRSAETWARTGEVEGVPEELAGVAGDGDQPPAGAGAGEAATRILFKARAGGAVEPDDPAAVRDELGPGQGLAGGTRAHMESAFGTSFGHVRVHTDPVGSRLSQRFNARAFTVGEHVAFGSGEYRPGTLVGDALIAHELAHVVQQSRAQATGESTYHPEAASTSLEADADRSALGVMSRFFKGAASATSGVLGGAVPRLRSGLALQRCGCSCKECKIKSGPTYTPSGTITATTSGTLKTAHFAMAAEFEKATACCCEVRQYIRWPTETPPNHAGFRPVANFSTNTWYEDRDGNDKRYGHRSGTYSDPRHPGDEYLNSAGNQDQSNGHIYAGADDPGGAASRTGEWQFELRVLDTKQNKEIGTPASVTVDF
jgi:hypothetical protein